MDNSRISVALSGGILVRIVFRYLIGFVDVDNVGLYVGVYVVLKYIWLKCRIIDAVNVSVFCNRCWRYLWCYGWVN